MPMGIEPESLRDMSVAALRELHSIADQMTTLSSMEEHKGEYAALAGLVQAQIQQREMAAAATIQIACRERRERDANRAEDERRIRLARERLLGKGINIDFEPRLVSTARLYHLATIIEAVDAVAGKNPYLTKKPAKSVGKSSLPPRKLKEEYEQVSGELDRTVQAIQQLVNERIESSKQAERMARTVLIPGDFRVEGALVDLGTFIYPGGGSIRYSAGKSYSLHPNRTLVHVRDEIPRNATPTLAGRYLAALVAGCKEFIKVGGCGPRAGEKIQVNGFLPSGNSFFWNMIGKKTASLQGYAGEIFHIDSGYANSRWHHE